MDQGKQRFNHPRISVVIYMMVNFPFRFVLIVDGSNDFAIEHPGVAIPVDAELVFLVTNFVQYPLQGKDECNAGSQWETDIHPGRVPGDGQTGRQAWCG